MPHCILECSQDILQRCNQQELMQHCFDAALSSEFFTADDIKVRVITLDAQRVGEIDHSQLHIQLKILDGRSVEQRKDLSLRVMTGVHLYLKDSGLTEVSLSVEVTDIERASYSKIIF